ncbi:heavy-metal-associated domain-containing protein [Pseudomonas aeruginosa]
MKSINVEVGGLVSSLSAEGVRRKLLQLPGVHHADVNYVAGSATVHLDEGQLSVEDLRQRIAECGYHCRGEQTPKHVCAPAAGVSADPSHAVHGHHGAPARQAQEMGMRGTTRMPPPRPHARRLRPRRPPPMLRTRPTQATLRWTT